MKYIYITTIGSTMDFFIDLVNQLVNKGNIVDIACNDEGKVAKKYLDLGCRVFHLDCSRKPLSKGNLDCVLQIRNIVDNNQYDIVHCHTPIAAACTRIACRYLRKKGLKVFYTAHGFHFYKGAPIKNWLIYYSVEKMCSYMTDTLICINKEDFALAKRKMKAKKIEYVPGVGVDIHKFDHCTVEEEKKRKELGLPLNTTVLFSAGELNENKNHELVIRAIAGLDVYYMIAGIGDKEMHIRQVAEEVGMSNRIRLLDFRRDVDELLQITDIFVLPSHREGLSLALMEAMVCGIPCAVSKIRGNTDLIDENGGTLFDSYSTDSCRQAILKLLNSDRQAMGEYNHKKIQKFQTEVVLKKMDRIYGE